MAELAAVNDLVQTVTAERAEAPEESFDLAETGRFAITPQSPPDAVAVVIDKVAVIKERMKALNEWLDAAVTEWVRANGPLQFGPYKYYIGDVTKVEWTDTPGALDAAFAASGGDWQTFARDFLAKDPIKHGSFEQHVGEAEAAKYFKRVKVEELRDNVATVKRKLQKSDVRFIR